MPATPPQKPTPPPPRRLPPDDGHWASALVLPALAAATSSFVVSSAALTFSLTSPTATPPTTPQPISAPSRTRSPSTLAIAARLGHTPHAPFLSQLRARGYVGYVAKPGGMSALYTDPTLPNPDPSLSSFRPSRTSLIISGTFTAGDYRQSVGPIMRNGILDTKGVRKASGRGGIALYDDGTFAIGRAKGGEFAAIQDGYFRPGRTVTSFMGGGALLIESGSAVSGADLAFRQRFDQGGFGLNATQFRRTPRVLLGVRDGYCYVLVANAKTGGEIQRDLIAAKFESVVMFDGSSGLFVRDRPGGAPAYRGRNSTGFTVTKWGVL